MSYVMKMLIFSFKVLVGKTADGKNIVGKILQIWKKVDPNIPLAKPRTVRRKPPVVQTKSPEKPQTVEELIIDNTGKILRVETPDEKPAKNVVFKKKYVSKEFLDQNIVKTLSGLMELESVQKNLAQKNLIIKHILKKSVDGKIQPQKEITYFYGHMDRHEVIDHFNEVKTSWTFIPDYKEEPDRTSGNEIDVSASGDPQQVDLEKGSWSPEKVSEGQRTRKFSETLPVNLIVIEDEFGKKRTKVTIPQLGGK